MLQVGFEEGLQTGDGGVLILALCGDGDRVALLHAQAHELHKLTGLDGDSVFGDGAKGGVLLCLLGQKTGGTGVDAQGGMYIFR